MLLFCALAYGPLKASEPIVVERLPVVQTRAWHFDTLSLDDGLSQSVVRSIAQDQQGFMWFGTEDGLNKYDGHTFTVYKPDPDDPTSLLHNYVYVAYVDREGMLWVGTQAGLDRLDRENDAFIHYQHNPEDSQSLRGTAVLSIYEDRDGRLWVGTQDGGLNLLDRTTGNVTFYPLDTTTPQARDDVWAIYEDRAGMLWIGTDKGLARLDPGHNALTRYRHDPQDSASLSDDKVRAILEDQDGVLWVGTDGGGLNQMDRSTHTFTTYEYTSAAESLSHNSVWAILEDRDGRFWIGTQDGLDQLDRDAGTFTHIRHSPGDPYSLSADTVWSIYEEQGGIIWFGTFGGGLSKFDPLTANFALYRQIPNAPNTLSSSMIWAIAEDENEALWLGTHNGGLNKFDRATGAVTVYRADPDDPHSLSNDDVRAVLVDHMGIVWAGTFGGGLARLDPQTGIFTHYLYDPDDPYSLPDSRVRVLFEDHAGVLWVGTQTGGLSYLERATGRFVRYQHVPDGLGESRVRAIYEDHTHTLWIGTPSGRVYLLNPERTYLAHYQPDPGQEYNFGDYGIYSFYEDSAGTLWIPTIGGGLYQVDRTGNVLQHYTEKRGLPNDTVYAVLADAMGNLWLSTNRGLACFDPQTETFNNYEVHDGLQSNEFNAGAYFKSASGELLFGGINGLNAFYPEQIQDNTHIPPVAITSFKTHNELVAQELQDGEHLTLSYQDNSISFEFVALDYAEPEANHYAYKLEGQDREWVCAGTRRYASYTNLRGGKYVFRVKVSNNDGVWNEDGMTVYLTITPPFWETWGFRGAVALLLIGVVVGSYRARVKSVEARSRELEASVKKRTADLSAANARLQEEIVERQRVERALRQSETRYRDLVENANSIILQMDSDGYITYMNRFGLDFFGYTEDEILGQPAVGTIVPETSTTGLNLETKLQDVLQHPEQYHTSENENMCRDGKHVWVAWTNKAIYDEAGAFSEVLCIGVDRTERKQAEEALSQQLQQSAIAAERNHLARELHDAVSQTLFSASLIADVLPRIWERNQEEAQRRLNELRELTRGALAEMRMLLIELRPSALEEAQITELFHQLVDAFTGKTRVPVALHISDEPCRLPAGVKIVFYRIAQEALNNITKHADANQVYIDLECQANATTLTIRDDGCGFDPDMSQATSHFGLHIMRERAENVGATFRLESAEGKGTSIEVKFVP